VLGVSHLSSHGLTPQGKADKAIVHYPVSPGSSQNMIASQGPS